MVIIGVLSLFVLGAGALCMLAGDGDGSDVTLTGDPKLDNAFASAEGQINRALPWPVIGSLLLVIGGVFAVAFMVSLL